MDNLVRITTALSNVQKIPPTVGDQSNSSFVGVTPVVLYTCPAGKRAQVQRLAFRTISYGTNTVMQANVKGERVRRTLSPAVDVDPVRIDQAEFIVLTAGETITLSGDGAGNNGSIDFIFTILELPA